MWNVETTDSFATWLNEQDRAMQLDVLAALNLLKQTGPHLGRPYVDTVYGSRITNMKELRTQSNGRSIRSFFVFDPKRKAIVLCAGNKEGMDERKFYKTMIRKAEKEFQKHLTQLKKG
ncbi:diaminopimelate decarboxylase [Pantoea rodasii]|uniref:Diaminopimelate decarboxylase n=1 Tax=Pantoea rodasii TaxID=1076549 RepID=A0A2M9W8V6_9GAMM|nr:type II toxin-antitoxin system RelE/ParE family toxin [Pantoea rodasii]ORM63621.1 diaminopimelate decarboxylase [Pantoea rodasii]PJZ03964.1 diaminopimelate decarboxylase [Pantoea rodasii]